MVNKGILVGVLASGLLVLGAIASPSVLEEISSRQSEGNLQSATSQAQGSVVGGDSSTESVEGDSSSEFVDGTSSQSNSQVAVSQSQVSQSSLRNVMYYSDWSIWGGQENYYPQDLPTEYYTHLNYCFLDFDSAGNLMFTDTDASVGASLNQEGVTWGEVNAGILPVLMAQRAEHPNMKLGISVGGWSKSGDFSLMTANASSRANFVSQLMMFLQYTGFDFIDIDWEYPGVVRQPDYVDNQLDEGTPAASPADKANYILLLQDLRNAMDAQGEALGKSYELSVALPMDQAKLTAGIDLAAMFQIIDFGNMMTYDARGAFDDVSGHHSPLYGNPADPFYDKGFSIDQTVSYLLSQGVPSEKIVIGAAFYSRGWENIENTEVVSGLPGLFAPTVSGSSGALNDLPVVSGDGGIAGGVWAYRNLDTLKASYSNLVEYWDDVAKAPYLYNGSAFFTYDNPQSIAEKTQYVHQNNLGGIISWQASNDAVTTVALQRDELTKAIYSGLYGASSLPEYPQESTPVNLNLSISSLSDSQVTFQLSNLELIQETTAVLRPLEAIHETVMFPVLYLEAGELNFSSAGYGTGTVSRQGDYTVVNLAEVYENRFLAQGQSISFTLNYDATGGKFTEDSLHSVTLYQRNTLNGQQYAPQVLLGDGKIEIPEGGFSGSVTTPGSTGGLADTGYTPQGAVGTLDAPVEWNRESEALGLYVPGSFVSYKGKIWEQVSDNTLWWEEPSSSSLGWTAVGEVEGYEAPAPTEWNREDEAVGLYVPDTVVSYQGKLYQQVAGQTLWWCEPGTDEASWKELG